VGRKQIIIKLWIESAGELSYKETDSDNLSLGSDRINDDGATFRK